MPSEQATYSEPLQRSQLDRETFCALALPELCLALPRLVLPTNPIQHSTSGLIAPYSRVLSTERAHLPPMLRALWHGAP